VKVWPIAESGGPGEDNADAVLAPGELRVQRDRVLVGTGTTPLELGDVQADGKRRMRAADWARGLRLDGRAAVLG
jgi:methionyl-tRNA formyltransferase